MSLVVVVGDKAVILAGKAATVKAIQKSAQCHVTVHPTHRSHVRFPLQPSFLSLSAKQQCRNNTNAGKAVQATGRRYETRVE